MSERKRGHDALDPGADCWELLTHDALSREEQALLRALADESHAAGARLAAHAPLDEGFRERMTDRLALQIRAERNVRRRRNLRVATASAMFAAAACALLLFRTPATDIPEYALLVEGQVATQRGAESSAHGSVELTPSSMLDLRLTPVTRASEPLALSTFLERDGKVTPWPVHAEQASSGAFRIRGVARDLLKTHYGELSIILLIGTKVVEYPPIDTANFSQGVVRRVQVRYLPETPRAVP